MPKIEYDVPPPIRSGTRGRFKDEDRLSLETLYASRVGATVFFPFPSKAKRLNAMAYAVGGPGWYQIHTEKLGVRVRKVEPESCTPSEPLSWTAPRCGKCQKSMVLKSEVLK